MRPHLSFAQIPARQVNKDLFQFVAPQVRAAAVSAIMQLERLDIRYALAGGLAMAAYGYSRATTDVDFLVGEEAFEQHGPIVSFKAGVPIEVEGIRIDYLSSAALGAQLEETLNHPSMRDGIAIAPVEVLIYMKLLAKRRRDLADVVELLKAGASRPQVRNYLNRYAAELVPLFEELANSGEL